VRNWVGAWLLFATALLVAGQVFPLRVQFYLAVPLAVIAAIVCLVLVVEKQ
jgi:hypothetical protein